VWPGLIDVHVVDELQKAREHRMQAPTSAPLIMRCTNWRLNALARPICGTVMGPCSWSMLRTARTRTSVLTMNTYTHVMPEHQAKALNKLEEALGGLA
jgi:hypothetical protein